MSHSHTACFASSSGPIAWLLLLRVVLGFATAGAAAATSRLLRGVPVVLHLYMYSLATTYAASMHAAPMAHIGMCMHAAPDWLMHACGHGWPAGSSQYSTHVYVLRSHALQHSNCKSSHSLKKQSYRKKITILERY